MLADQTVQMKHMFHHRTCLRIPFFNISTGTEYEEMRLFREVINIYFDMKREYKSGYGRRTAFYATGRALEYLYHQPFLIVTNNFTVLYFR